jgi:tRNA pseudouridine synthase 10
LKKDFDYNLCDWCLKRQSIPSLHLKDIDEDCEICHGIRKQIHKISCEIIQATRDYEYHTFLIGLMLDHSFYDNEDKFRSRFKIRGKENIKSSLLREIRRKFGELSHKKLDLDSPDISVNLGIGKKFETIVRVNSSTIVLSGRYMKPIRFRVMYRHPDNSLKVNRSHIENIIKKKLMNLFETESITFWPLGKEEPESLVLGSGRPFYISIKNSKLVSFKHEFSIRSNGLIFNIKEKLKALPKTIPFYAMKVRTLVSCEDNLKASVLKLVNDSGIRIVELTSTRNKNWKFIYQMKSIMRGQKKLELIILCDNGFPIRRFIDGDEDVSPNLCQILYNKCKCQFFDILDIVSEEDLLN